MFSGGKHFENILLLLEEQQDFKQVAPLESVVENITITK